jgi:opacity protein-like surface antigen
MLFAMIFCSIASAAPLTDYSAGKTSIDLTLRDAKNSFGIDDNTFNPRDSKVTVDSTITVGVGNKFALQYRNFKPKPNSSNGDPFEIKTKEVNLLYQINKNVSVLSGLLTASGAINSTNHVGYMPYTLTFEQKNFWQVGLIANNQIAPKTTLWGMATVGENLTNAEIGLSQNLSKNIDFNVSYRHFELKNCTEKCLYANGFSTGPDYGYELQGSGFGCGITYKF